MKLELTKSIPPGERVLAEMKAKKEAARGKADLKSDTNIIPQRDFTVLKSQWVNSMVTIIANHTTANEQQASVKTLQNIAYLFSYGGMVNYGLPFYAVDLSPSGTGKTEVVKKCRQMLLSPVFDKQQESHLEDLERYKEETLSSKGKEKEFIPLPKMHKCIHVTDTSPEALFESFEAQKAQMVEIGELGRKLKNQKHQPLVDYIVEGYGARELPAPNYKNQRMSKTLKIEDPQLFFYGDTTLRYLGKGTFFEHIEGGLLNRCFLIYNPKVPEFDDLPEDYTIDRYTVERYNDIAIRLISFAEDHKYKSVKVIDTSYRRECERYFYDKRMDLINTVSPFANLYARTIQNFRALINLFHLIECFDNGEFREIIDNSSIKQAFEFMSLQMEAYPLLMDELSGVMDEVRSNEKSSKLIEYINTHKLPISFRELSQAHFGKKADIQKMIAGIYDSDKSNITRKL
jgi:hypothetical protein